MSPSPSPPTRRVVDVLGLLSGSDSGLTSSEVASGLGISGSTCALILAELARAQYVERLPDKSYVLGPGILPVLDALRSRYPLLGPGHETLVGLHRDLRYPCSLSRIGADHLLTLDGVGHEAESRTGGLGERLPLAPPWGTVATAWRTASEIETWLDSAVLPLDRAARRRHFDVMSGVRSLGAGVWRQMDPGVDLIGRLNALLGSLKSEPRPQDALAQLSELFGPLTYEAYLPKELSGSGELSVSYIVAAVFGPDALPHYQIEIQVMTPSISSADLREVLQVITSAAGALTNQIGGVRPSR